MIDPQVFARWMRVFSERIGKPLSDDGNAAYYTILSAELQTADFEAAMQAIYRDHKYATWPAPGDIIAAVRPKPALEAAGAWTQIADAVRLRNPQSPLYPQLVRCAGTTAADTFIAIGGLERFRRLSDWQLESMRAEFLDRFADVKRSGPPALTSGPQPLRLVRGAASIGAIVPTLLPESQP